MKTLAREIEEALAILNPRRESGVLRATHSRAGADETLPAGREPVAEYVRANRETAGDPAQPAAAKTWWLP